MNLSNELTLFVSGTHFLEGDAPKNVNCTIVHYLIYANKGYSNQYAVETIQMFNSCNNLKSKVFEVH